MNIRNWINDYCISIRHKISRTRIEELKEWNSHQNIISRADNSFFSIKTIKPTNARIGLIPSIIIDQPEIGVLGFLINGYGDDIQILLQAKAEPGNINLTQIGPTVQATVSNYKRKHNGSETHFINLFINDKIPKEVSILQSEQGSRFFNKYNQNAILRVSDLKEYENFNNYRWFPFNHIIQQIDQDFLFNTDFKSVISHMFEMMLLKSSMPSSDIGLHLLNSYFRHRSSNNYNSIISKISCRRKNASFNSELCGLDFFYGWDEKTGLITSNEGLIFNYDFFEISISDRENPCWGQPLLTKNSIEHIILFASIVDDQILFVFKEISEIGYKNYLQLGPTIQLDESPNYIPNIIYEKLLISFNQSEEGGRFYQNISKYSIYLIDSLEYYEVNDEFYVLNAFEICKLLSIPGIFTNESRSLIATLIKFL